MCITDVGTFAGTHTRLSSKKEQGLVMSLQHKILRTANAPTSPPDETEAAVAQALLDLENSVPDPQLKAFHKVQARYVLSCSLVPHSRAPAYSHRITFQS